MEGDFVRRLSSRKRRFLASDGFAGKRPVFEQDGVFEENCQESPMASHDNSVVPLVPAAWEPHLRESLDQPGFSALNTFLKQERADNIVFPPAENTFAALEYTRLEDVRVVILGQDPYHDDGQAHGLSFSVPHGQRLPPSLRNIVKELHADLEEEVPVTHGDLSAWAQQGVLLLNTVLTVRAHEANSHRGKGWETVTDRVIAAVSDRKRPAVFVLWGAAAGKKKPLIDASRHHVIETVHPSPLSARRGFFGSRPFSTINEKLEAWDQEPIDWFRPWRVG
jgi:uracil-DNA glycosylase